MNCNNKIKMGENNNPRILVVGLDKNPTELIQKIAGKETEPVNNEYPWQIKNKYYTANVSLLGLPVKWNDSTEHPIVDRVEALVVFFNSEHENSVDGLVNLENYIKNYDVEVKLLVCDRFSENAAEHSKVTNWCTVNHFEYIDLDFDANSTDSESDYDGFVNDTRGVDRVIEDLQVHIWSNAMMVGKGNPSHKDDEFGETELDEFCELYTQLSAIAEGISSLPRDQRLQSAEQVVKQFWNAINGSDDEFSDSEVDAIGNST